MNTRKPLLPALALLVIAAPATAGQAYTWTDSEGVTHFSESAPPDRVQDAGRIELQSAPVIPGPTPERFRAISEQSARMAAERRKRELAREKRRQLEEKERQARLAELEAEEEQQERYYYPYPYWYPPAYRYPRHHRHKHPRHPHHQPSRSKFQPGKTITQKRNAEALRDAYRHW
ncbi:MAG: DUF4124 domain-containing protein [Gammaproteobacteria bacterium]|nr:DUF4124 domain-containing protein [Gammaproteobacteria bacterium]